jgi:hypothetical protein
MLNCLSTSLLFKPFKSYIIKVRAAWRKKRRKEEKEKERKEGKGREFIPVEMALTGDAN